MNALMRLLCNVLPVLLICCAPVIRYGKGDPTYAGPKHSGVYMHGANGASPENFCPAPHVWMDWGEWEELAGWRGPIEYVVQPHGGDPIPVYVCVTWDVFLRGTCSGNKVSQGRDWELIIMPRGQLERLGLVVHTEGVLIVPPGGDPAVNANAVLGMIEALHDPQRPVPVSITDLQATVCPAP